MSPWQSPLGRGQLAHNAHFIWDLKCFLTAELKQSSHPALDAPYLSWSQIYTTRTISTKQICSMKMYPPILNFYPNTLKSTCIIAYALKNLFTLQFLFVCSLIAFFFFFFSLISGYMHHLLAIREYFFPLHWVVSWGRSSWHHSGSGLAAFFPTHSPPTTLFLWCCWVWLIRSFL